MENAEIDCRRASGTYTGQRGRPVFAIPKNSSFFILLALFPSLHAGCGRSGDYTAAVAEGRDSAADMIGRTGASFVSLAFVDENKPVWVETFGIADKASTIVPAVDTMYAIRSMNKMIAAIQK